MNINSLTILASIEISIDDFASSEQKMIWAHWVSSHPDLNELYDAPLVVRRIVLETVRARADRLSYQVRSPSLSTGEADYVRAIIARLNDIVINVSNHEKNLCGGIDE